MASNRFGVACCCTPPPTPPFRIGVPGRGPCGNTGSTPTPPSWVIDGPVFGGEVATSVSYDGGAPASTGSTSILCAGAGDYVFSVTCTNPHVVVTPATVTITANSGCTALAYSPPGFFDLHFDYWDAPGTPGTRAGDSFATICGCPCVMPGTVHVSPTNRSGDAAIYLKKTGGVCQPRGSGIFPPDTAVFTPTDYDTNVYHDEALTFQPRPADLPPDSPLGFSVFGGFDPGPVVLPSYGYYSDPFEVVFHPNESCGSTCDPDDREPGSPNNAGPPVVRTGWYFLNCASGASRTNLTLYLVQKTEGWRYECFYGLTPTWIPTTSWRFSAVWTWTGTEADSDCDPLLMSTGYVTRGVTPTFQMVLTE